MTFLMLDAEKARDLGLNRAAANAGQAWSDEAYRCLQIYIRRFSGCLVMAEVIREFADCELGLENPPDPRAWGHILLRAARAGLLQRNGYAPSSSASRHKGPATVWRIL